ncbi:MAG TPA: hypothetical protein PK395_20315 [bacterium]|nr:hypothetical protein [bacterium]
MQENRPQSRLFVCCCLLVVSPTAAIQAVVVEVSLTQGLVPICDMLGTTPIPSWLVLSITGAERIGTAEFRIDLGVFEARELKPVDASFDAMFSCDNGYLDVSISRTGIEPPPSVLYLSFAVLMTGDRSAGCGFGEIAFLSVSLFDLDRHAITEAELIPGSWYISGCDILGYIMVRVIDGRSSSPISGAKVTLLGFVGGPGISGPGYGGLPPITDATGLAYVEYPPDPSFLPHRPPEPARTNLCEPCSCIQAWLHVEPTENVSIAFDPFDALVELRVNEDRMSLMDLFEEVTIIVGGPSTVEDWRLYD